MAQRGGYGTCPTSQPEHTARVRVSDGIRDADIGAQIQEPLEEIFSRIDQAGPLLEQLGDVNGVLATLHSDRMRGVCSNTVEERRAVFGPNHLPEDPPLTFWAIYQAAWKDSMIQLLTASAIVSLVLGLTVPEPGEATVNYQTGWIEGFAILCSVLIVTSVSSINDYRKEQKFMKLTQANAAQPIQVMRDGEEVTIDVTEIVVGDVVNLVPGLVAPADGLYVRGLSVLMDESSVTGENDAKRKNTEHPIILSGTVVSTAEEAYMVACAVGERSFGGKLLIESKQGSTPRPTPLQERLDDLAELIGRVGLTAALLLFTILGVMEAFRMMQHQPSTDVRHFLDYFLLCVAIVVVAVPEGLPLAVTIALAYSQNKMHDDNNQVRRLRACETMGNATQICSDKTGTLTQNLMSVVQGYVGMQYFSVRRPGDLPEPIDLIKMCQTSSPASSGSPISKSAAAAATSSAASPSSSSEAACPAAFRESVGLLMEGIALNSSSEKVVHHTDRDGRTVEPFWQWRSEKGNKTDNALLDFIDRALMKAEDRNNLQRRPHQKLREAYRHDSDYAIFPFTSDRKRMSVVVRRADGTMIHHVKGGSDRILPLCDRYVNESGSVVEMDADARERIQQQVSKLAKAANRTIGIAFTEVIESKSIPTEEPTGPLIWLSLIGIQDPLRPEVVEAVRKCQMAGVTVRMCTGDNIETAVAISRQCGIFNPFYMDLAMTGQEFRNLVYDAYGDESRMEEFWPVLDRMTVMARSQPLDKQLLVLMLMTRGEVVAVTGDGTNDAPALRLANVGFVMRSGTDIAVKSADIVLLDDNFRSVQRAVVWGRCVNDNIRKFLQLQLTVNYVSVALTFIGCIMARGSASPLTTVQLLWVNLIMDTLAALALATEQPTEECLLRGPTSRSAPLISRRMHVTIGVVAAYILGITLAIQYFGNVWFEAGELHSPQHQTIVFNVFVLCTLAHMCNCRKLYEELNAFEGMITRSRPFVMVLLFCLAFQVMAVETFGEFMSVAPLRADQWVGCLVLASVVWLCGIVSRMVLVTEPVFAKEFSPAALDEEAKKMLLKLDAAVAKAQEDGTHANGKYMEDARRLRARAHWRQARQHHINANKIVNAFRRARIEGLDASSTRSL